MENGLILQRLICIDNVITYTNYMYYENRTLRQSNEQLQHGKEIVKTYFLNSRIECHIELTNSRNHGKYKKWFGNGILKKHYNFVDGHKRGSCENFDEQGVLTFYFNYTEQRFLNIEERADERANVRVNINDFIMNDCDICFKENMRTCKKFQCTHRFCLDCCYKIKICAICRSK